MCTFSSLFKHFFLYKLMFFLFLSGELSKQPKISHFVDFDWENALKWLEWHELRVWGVPNPMTQVLSLYDKQFLKNKNFRQKFHILLILTGKMHQNRLSSTYLGSEACQIQWHLFWVSMISGSWKIKISGKNFTFCWFWLGKMHQNGLSGMYLAFEVCQIQWCRFQFSMISGLWKIKISGKNFTLLILLEKCIKMAWVVCI